LEELDRDSTRYTDKHGIEIKRGDTVIDPEGFFGSVVFVNCAWRYDINGGQYLNSNSSLLFSDSKKPKDFVVINKEAPL
jgi:hypothetical protein